MTDAGLDILGWIARGVGLFYLVGGLFVLRAARIERLLDEAIYKITLEKPEPDPADRLRLRLGNMFAIAILTMVSGVLLIFLLRAAVYAFLANAALQGAYLTWARRALPPTDADAGRGRRRSTNAFIVWLVMTALVLLLFEQGRLT